MSNADEILKLKELLDNNIITQEEFEKKKKEILGSEGNIKNGIYQNSYILDIFCIFFISCFWKFVKWF